MSITEYISITELSRLTGKSRPTLYKYINDYDHMMCDDIPYLYVKLFDKITKEPFNKSAIINYCNSVFKPKQSESVEDSELEEIITLIKQNRNKLELSHLKTIIEGEIKNEQ